MPPKKSTSLEIIIRRIIDSINGNPPLSGIDLADRFRPDLKGHHDVARNLNAAFLIVLSGSSHALYEYARDYLDFGLKDQEWKDITSFYLNGVKRINNEFAKTCGLDKEFEKIVNDAALWCSESETSWDNEARHKIWGVFFPEGAWCIDDYTRRITDIVNRRQVHVSRLNPRPIKKPAREVLFTSNILITLPHEQENTNSLHCSKGLQEKLKTIRQEDQLNWFDHPIRIGTKTDINEAVYGLKGLNEAIGFEKRRGTVKPDDRVTCLLSVSVTHKGLQGIALDYLKEIYSQVDQFPHLDVYMFSETGSERILDEIILPAAKEYLGLSDGKILRRMFGVDGEYGRHFSFLKAIGAFWQVLIDPAVKGSFKIDLDQVFAQELLVNTTGLSALEHFQTPLWGADAVDNNGHTIELGMMAGALVNKSDADQSLFTPDVPIPSIIPAQDSVIFFSPLPMALSTRAEMMTQYNSNRLDGERTCMQRIHVTGGTTAILIDSLRRHRPFTPTFIGRAEDQAYLQSCLFKNSHKNLRCLHKPGLIMQHDKEVLAVETDDAGKPDKFVGDLARTLSFSYYVRALPWQWSQIKKILDPFTGCFVTRIPISVVYLRLALNLAGLFAGSNQNQRNIGLELQKLSINRLDAIIQRLTRKTNPLIREYEEEKNGWDIYYDVLDHIEHGLADRDDYAINLMKKAKQLIKDCNIKVGQNQTG